MFAFAYQQFWVPEKGAQTLVEEGPIGLIPLAYHTSVLKLVKLSGSTIMIRLDGKEISRFLTSEEIFSILVPNRNQKRGQNKSERILILHCIYFPDSFIQPLPSAFR